MVRGSDRGAHHAFKLESESSPKDLPWKPHAVLFIFPLSSIQTVLIFILTFIIVRRLSGLVLLCEPVDALCEFPEIDCSSLINTRSRCP